jgi:hypothetical protein
MSDLDHVKGLIARGDKEKAIRLLASILLKNRRDVEAWLLMGEIVDDPARKKDCYNQVLKLSPYGLHALTKLQELGEPSPDGPPVTIAAEDEIDNKLSAKESGPTSNFVSNRIAYPPANKSKEGPEIIGYVIGGIAGFLAILYVIASPGDSSNDSNILYLGLIFLSLIAGIIVVSVNNKHRG